MSNADSATTALDVAVKIGTPFVTFGLGVVAGNWRRLSRWVRRQDPIQIHIESDPELIYANMPDWITFPQFIPRAEEELPTPPRKTLEMSKWAKGLGGFPAWNFELQVTIQAWDDLNVVVDRLRVKAQRREIPNGVVAVKGVGGASLQPAQLDVELSTWAPTVTPRRAGSGEEFQGFTFQLKGGDVERFILHVSHKDQAHDDDEESVDAYEWTAFLDLLVGNKRKTVEITDSGKPFVLVKRDRRPTVWV